MRRHGSVCSTPGPARQRGRGAGTYDAAVAAYGGKLRGAVRDVEERDRRAADSIDREADAQIAAVDFRPPCAPSTRATAGGLGSLFELEDVRATRIAAQNVL